MEYSKFGFPSLISHKNPRKDDIKNTTVSVMNFCRTSFLKLITKIADLLDDILTYTHLGLLVIFFPHGKKNKIQKKPE